ncbi:MAG: hypothetical protein AB7E55_09585 [Pigmentiphaga sp.]
MSKIFGRNYRLTIKSGEDELVYEPPMQVRFSVDIWPGNAGGVSEITLYGASPDTRNAIYAKFDSISLAAGYGERMGLIFAGDIINIETGRDGVDKYIKFYARPTGQAQAEAFVSKSWGANTPQIDIIREVAESLLLPVVFIGDFSDLPRALKGRTVCTSSAACLTELANLHGFTWFMGANRLMIIRVRDGVAATAKPGEPHIISAETGMVGSPQVLIQGIEVKTKLDASIIPDDTVDVRADTRNFAFSGVYEHQMERNPAGGDGLYRVLGVKHEGDFYGGAWDTSVSGVRQQ